MVVVCALCPPWRVPVNARPHRRPHSLLAAALARLQVLNGERLPAYQYQDNPKATPAVKAVDLPASQFLANG